MTATAQRAAPIDSDQATLTALNTDYIDSVQNSDVKRFYSVQDWSARR